MSYEEILVYNHFNVPTGCTPIFFRDSELGHSSIDRGNCFIISDVQDSGDNELIRVDLKTGKGEVLCWPDTVYAGVHVNHVHPSISAHENYVDFSSARSGSPDLYVLPLNY